MRKQEQEEQYEGGRLSPGSTPGICGGATVNVASIEGGSEEENTS